MAHRVDFFKQQAKRKTKFNNKGTEYGGVWFHSKFEAQYAENLDWLIKGGELLKWERQVKLDLTVNGHHICNYFIDFKEYHVGGDIVYTEVKGPVTPLWQLKWRLTEALWPNIEGVEERATLKIVR